MGKYCRRFDIADSLSQGCAVEAGLHLDRDDVRAEAVQGQCGLVARTAHEQQTKNQDSANDVCRDHQPPPIHAVDDDARDRTDEGDRQELDDHHPRYGGCRACQIEQERVHGDGVEPIAELRDGLADEEKPEVAIRAEKRDVRVQG